jgi:TolB-like protein
VNQLLAELRRRNVFRVAAAYLVGSWLVLQIVGAIESSAGLPDWTDGMALVLLLIGLPIALVVAWAFELTPAGFKKTDTGTEQAEASQLGSTDYALIGLMVLVLVLIGFQLMSRAPVPAEPVEVAATPDAATTPNADIEVTDAPVIEASIAVLPFADFSPGGDQQYFSDGIAEELLNALAQFPELRVAARTSAFSFRGDDVDLRAVGEALGVAHVLEGSVRHANGQIRITAQLIRVSDGFHLWSQTYERTLDDVFAVQDEIVTELSRVLQVRLGVGAAISRAGSSGVNAQAYEQYLRGLGLWGAREDDANRTGAFIAFKRATEYDPNFADAWAALGMSIVRSSPGDLPGISETDFTAEARRALERAQELDPNMPRLHAAYSAFFVNIELDIEQATFHARRAMEIAPNAAYTNYALADVLSYRGEVDELMRAVDRAISMDPLNPTVRRAGAEFLSMYGLGESMNAGQENCVGWGSVFSCLLSKFRAGVHAGNRADVTIILEAIDALEPDSGQQDFEAPPGFADAAEFLAMVAAFHFDEGNALAARGEQVLANSVEITASWAQALAHSGDIDQALDILFAIFYEQWDPTITWHLTEGLYAFPDALRRHPRFHEFWALPRMAELAAVRRANGQTAGLPLPIEPTQNEADE